MKVKTANLQEYQRTYYQRYYSDNRNIILKYSESYYRLHRDEILERKRMEYHKKKEAAQHV